MIRLFTLVLFLFTFAFAAPAPAPGPAPAPAAVDDIPASPPPAAVSDSEAPALPRLPLKWRTRFGDAVAAGSTLTLAWHGGDERGYEVYYVPRWPGQLQYSFVSIEKNTTAQEIEWSVPELSAYPRGTEFIFAVKDGSGGPGFEWYDLSAAIPLR